MNKKELKPKAFKFLQSVAFNKNAASDAHPDYAYFSVDHNGKPKVYEVSGELQATLEFEKFVAAGYIVDAEDHESPEHETLLQRNQRLSAKLMAESSEQAEAPVAAEDEAQVSPDVEEQAHQADEDFSQEQEAEQRKPKKRK